MLFTLLPDTLVSLKDSIRKIDDKWLVYLLSSFLFVLLTTTWLIPLWKDHVFTILQISLIFFPWIHLIVIIWHEIQSTQRFQGRFNDIDIAFNRTTLLTSAFGYNFSLYGFIKVIMSMFFVLLFILFWGESTQPLSFDVALDEGGEIGGDVRLFL